MMMTQERTFLKAQQQLREMEQFVEQAANDGQRIDVVEPGLMARLLEIGRTMLESFVAAQGNGDAGDELPAGELTVGRLDQPHTCRYLSIFGELRIRRYVYAVRAGQKIERCPLDERLGLPAGEFSYVLEDWLQRLCVKESFAEAVSSLQTLLGLAPSSRAAEQMNQRMSEHAEAFHIEQSPPPGEEKGRDPCGHRRRQGRAHATPLAGACSRLAPASRQRGESQQEANGLRGRGLQHRPLSSHGRRRSGRGLS